MIGTVNNLPPASNLAQDGTFGSATAAAVKAVQQFFGIAQDGIVGPQTWSVLVTRVHPVRASWQACRAARQPAK